MIGFITWLVIRLMGYVVGLWSGLLLACEPYLVGMGQIVHVDMLLALFMLGGVLSTLIYLDEKRWRWLVGGGIMTGLALGTKLLPALWLVVFVGVMLKAQYGFGWRAVVARDYKLWARQVLIMTRKVGFYIGVVGLSFYLVWPALWVKTNLDDYYQRDVVSVTTQEHVAQAESEEPIAPASFYGRTVLSRTTPFVLLISVAVMALAVKYLIGAAVLRHMVGRLEGHDGKKDLKRHVSARTIGWLTLYLIGYLVLITLVAKKADRYALPALVVLPVLAGAGLTIVWPIAKERLSWMKKQGVRRALVSFVSVAIVLQPLSWMPYTVSFNSSMFMIRPMTQQGWGEGLDEAAEWLNAHPLGEKITVASWYPGVMRAYFRGKTMSLSSRNDDRVGFVVTYRNMHGRAPDDIATNVLGEFADKEPVHVVSIGGSEYVWVYDVMGLHYWPKNVGELVGSMEVGQKMKAIDNWSGVSIGMSNFSGRSNTKNVTLHVRESIDAVEDVRTVVVNAADIVDGEWHEFNFEPIKGVEGQEYYIALTSVDSVPGDAVTVRYVDTDMLCGEMVLRRDMSKMAGESVKSDFDLAYRLLSGVQ